MFFFVFDVVVGHSFSVAGEGSTAIAGALVDTASHVAYQVLVCARHSTQREKLEVRLLLYRGVAACRRDGQGIWCACASEALY